jgi:hypothetical protein
MSVETIKQQYEQHCQTPSDIYEYLPVLSHIVTEGGFHHVTEFGVRDVNSTWGFLWGLCTSTYPATVLRSYDLVRHQNVDLVESAVVGTKVDFKFALGNTAEIDIEPTHVLFIDTEHTYQHLWLELNRHAHNVTNLILVHDTSGPYANWEDWPADHPRRGDLAKFPERYGMWPGCVDWCKEHIEWRIIQRYEVGNGLTIMERR